DVPVDRRLDALAGKDVILVFVESYGESALRDPRYAGPLRRRLQAMEQQITTAGLSARSGWLGSPTMGGLSWLAHGTLLSGLWVDSQQRYDRLIVSERTSLNQIFRQSGWRSVAVMPAITMAWPEAGYFGYDRVYAAADLGYRGKPFNWVTMPDQYTLSAFETRERSRPHGPVMAEIALISSHAPWTPIPRLLDWPSVGDGTVFNAQAQAGDPPEVVWRDPDRVRSHYAASIDYTLEVLGSYMATHGKNTVFILLGDHQPAPLVTGQDASRTVPVHLISDDPLLLDRLDATRWGRGMTPGNDLTTQPMDRLREELVRAFSGRGDNNHR
ncbi:MAG: sulfatase-like hydrolase/transferase, partial [Phyllobacterium sp.]